MALTGWLALTWIYMLNDSGCLAYQVHVLAARPAVYKCMEEEKALGAHSIKRPDIKGNAAPGGTSSADDRVVGKYGYEREVMDIGNKRNGGRFSEGMKESGFVAFNADYHEPRHHPPKNN
ncbi:hypothetical protein OIU76_013711 [Salix suchowensis]|nr:hypothetical protein OIU76_013711 [Salix suchowensis]